MKIPGLGIDADAAELPWEPTQVEGIQWLPLQLGHSSSESAGQQRGSASVLIRMAPGCGYGAHRHLGGEDVLVLAGGYRDARGSYTTGEHVHYEEGSAHAPVALGERGRAEGPDNPACILFAVASGGIELLGRDES